MQKKTISIKLSLMMMMMMIINTVYSDRHFSGSLFVGILGGGETSLGRGESLRLVVERQVVGLGHGLGHFDGRRLLLRALLLLLAAARAHASHSNDRRAAAGVLAAVSTLIQLLVRVLARHGLASFLDID